jgi:hypothetical protein
MRRRRLLAFLLALGSLLGALLLRRRGGRRRHERVDLYYADGSMVTLPDGAPEVERLTALAREFVRTARS